MHSPSRLLRDLIGFALVALWLVAPAVIWTNHGTAHAASPVAIDAHHYHDGAMVVMDDKGAPADEDGNKRGHDHMPSVLAEISGTLPAELTLPLSLPPRLPPPPAVVSATPEISEPPPARPPRSS